MRERYRLPIELEFALFLYHRTFIVFDHADFENISKAFNADLSMVSDMIARLLIDGYIELEDGWHFLKCGKIQTELLDMKMEAE